MKKYLKNDSWHNLFMNHVVMRVDEPMFSVLFSDGQGAPNASILVLVTKAEVDARFTRLGNLARHLISLFQDEDNARYQTLKTAFEQHTVDEENKATPIENEKISPKSIQSPHDEHQEQCRNIHFPIRIPLPE